MTLAGSGRVVLGAIGDDCKGWPTVSVRVDGVVVGSTTIVDATRYGAYPVGRAVAAGTHAVTISFVNDYRDATCDRNVHVGFARMETAGGPSTPAPTTRPATRTGSTATASPRGGWTCPTWSTPRWSSATT